MAARPDHGPGPAQLLLPAQRQRPSAAPPAPRLGMSAGEARPRGGREAGSTADAPASAQPPAFKEAAIFFFSPLFLPPPQASSPSPPSSPHLFTLFAPTCQALWFPPRLVAVGGRARGCRRRRCAALRGQRACSRSAPTRTGAAPLREQCHGSPARRCARGEAPQPEFARDGAGRRSGASVRGRHRRGARAEARSCPRGSARPAQPPRERQELPPWGRAL